jgi:hypothetical protein
MTDVLLQIAIVVGCFAAAFTFDRAFQPRRQERDES